MLEWDGYARLFGEEGAALSDGQWIAQANDALPPNLSALNARFTAGNRAEEFLQIRYMPGPASFSFTRLSCGSIAEMLGQTAQHCGAFVTSYPCPALTLTVNFLHTGVGASFVATAGMLAVKQGCATVAAELTDERERLIASASVVVSVGA